MLEKAIARYQIDASKSYFIGDRERDVIAGEAAGVKGILIESDQPLGEVLEQISWVIRFTLYVLSLLSDVPDLKSP